MDEYIDVVDSDDVLSVRYKNNTFDSDDIVVDYAETKHHDLREKVLEILEVYFPEDDSEVHQQAVYDILLAAINVLGA